MRTVSIYRVYLTHGCLGSLSGEISLAPADHTWSRSETVIQAILLVKDCYRDPPLSGVVGPKRPLTPAKGHRV
jgi:hypothetical protein